MKPGNKLGSALCAVVLLVTASPSVGEATQGGGTPNLVHRANVPYKGGSDIEFLSRTETVTRQVVSYKVVRTRRVSCRAKRVRCRRGQRFKTIRTRPRRVAVRTTVQEQVNRSYAFTGSLSGYSGGTPVGLRVMDITDPAAPRVASFLTCQSNQLDVQVTQRDGRSYVLLGLDYGASNAFKDKPSDCHAELGLPRSFTGVLVVDVTDASAPRPVGSVSLPYGAHNSTLHPAGRYLYASDSELEGPFSRSDERPYATSRIQIVDLANLNAPAMVNEVDIPGWGSAHDITFNASGSRAYSAALTQTQIFDTTDPAQPKLLTTIADPEINIHHQADPYTLNGREYLVITDELAGAAGNAYCPGGGLHIYDITDELVPVKTSRFFAPSMTTLFDEQRWFICTSHVLRIYPEHNILTIAWYSAGIWVIDISDPSAFKAVGFADPTGIDQRQTNAWSAKLFNGHIFTNDMGRGMDVFRYDGPASERTVADALSDYAEGPQARRSAPTVDFLPRAEDGRPLFCFEAAKGRPLLGV